jgi:hypothetical protein
MLRYILLFCVLQGIADSAIAQSKTKDPMSWKDILNRAGPPVHPPGPQEPAFVPEPGDDIFGPNPLKFSPPPDTRHSLQKGDLKVVNVSEYDALYLREIPNENSKILGMIPPDGNGIVSLGEREDNWILVRYDHIEGWVNIHFIARENE